MAAAHVLLRLPSARDDSSASGCSPACTLASGCSPACTLVAVPAIVGQALVPLCAGGTVASLTLTDAACSRRRVWETIPDLGDDRAYAAWCAEVAGAVAALAAEEPSTAPSAPLPGPPPSFVLLLLWGSARGGSARSFSNSTSTMLDDDIPTQLLPDLPFLAAPSATLAAADMAALCPTHTQRRGGSAASEELLALGSGWTVLDPLPLLWSHSLAMWRARGGPSPLHALLQGTAGETPQPVPASAATTTGASTAKVSASGAAPVDRRRRQLAAVVTEVSGQGGGHGSPPRTRAAIAAAAAVVGAGLPGGRLGPGGGIPLRRAVSVGGGVEPPLSSAGFFSPDLLTKKLMRAGRRARGELEETEVAAAAAAPATLVASLKKELGDDGSHEDDDDEEEDEGELAGPPSIRRHGSPGGAASRSPRANNGGDGDTGNTKNSVTVTEDVDVTTRKPGGSGLPQPASPPRRGAAAGGSGGTTATAAAGAATPLLTSKLGLIRAVPAGPAARGRRQPAPASTAPQWLDAFPSSPASSFPLSSSLHGSDWDDYLQSVLVVDGGLRARLLQCLSTPSPGAGALHSLWEDAATLIRDLQKDDEEARVEEAAVAESRGASSSSSSSLSGRLLLSPRRLGRTLALKARTLNTGTPARPGAPASGVSSSSETQPIGDPESFLLPSGAAKMPPPAAHALTSRLPPRVARVLDRLRRAYWALVDPERALSYNVARPVLVEPVAKEVGEGSSKEEGSSSSASAPAPAETPSSAPSWWTEPSFNPLRFLADEVPAAIALIAAMSLKGAAAVSAEGASAPNQLPLLASPVRKRARLDGSTAAPAPAVAAPSSAAFASPARASAAAHITPSSTTSTNRVAATPSRTPARASPSSGQPQQQLAATPFRSPGTGRSLRLLQSAQALNSNDGATVTEPTISNTASKEDSEEEAASLSPPDALAAMVALHTELRDALAPAPRPSNSSGTAVASTTTETAAAWPLYPSPLAAPSLPSAWGLELSSSAAPAQPTIGVPLARYIVACFLAQGLMCPPGAVGQLPWAPTTDAGAASRPPPPPPPHCRVRAATLQTMLRLYLTALGFQDTSATTNGGTGKKAIAAAPQRLAGVKRPRGEDDGGTRTTTGGGWRLQLAPNKQASKAKAKAKSTPAPSAVSAQLRSLIAIAARELLGKSAEEARLSLLRETSAYAGGGVSRSGHVRWLDLVVWAPFAGVLPGLVSQLYEDCEYDPPSGMAEGGGGGGGGGEGEASTSDAPLEGAAKVAAAAAAAAALARELRQGKGVAAGAVAAAAPLPSSATLLLAPAPAPSPPPAVGRFGLAAAVAPAGGRFGFGLGSRTLPSAAAPPGPAATAAAAAPLAPRFGLAGALGLQAQSAAPAAAAAPTAGVGRLAQFGSLRQLGALPVADPAAPTQPAIAPPPPPPPVSSSSSPVAASIPAQPAASLAVAPETAGTSSTVGAGLRTIFNGKVVVVTDAAAAGGATVSSGDVATTTGSAAASVSSAASSVRLPAVISGGSAGSVNSLTIVPPLLVVSASATPVPTPSAAATPAAGGAGSTASARGNGAAASGASRATGPSGAKTLAGHLAAKSAAEAAFLARAKK